MHTPDLDGIGMGVHLPPVVEKQLAGARHRLLLTVDDGGRHPVGNIGIVPADERHGSRTAALRAQPLLQRTRRDLAMFS